MLDPQGVSFGLLLRRLRVEAGLSQHELAERARISVEAVSAYERGVRRAPYRDTDTLTLLIDALGASDVRGGELLAAAERARRRGPERPAPFVERDVLRAVAPSHNLPSALTSFVGRESAIAAICELVAAHRLVTLVGTGGVGKTRVALQAGSRLLDAAADGVWLVELAPLASADYVPTTIAEVLGFKLSGSGDPVTDLVKALRLQRLLLIFDSCEHLVDAAGSVIARLLRGCPDIRVLATSRQSLGLAGEETYRIASLELAPPASDGVRAGDVLGAEAVALFVARAQTADKRFELTDENAPAVAEICRRLDGIPLAIELAAARAGMLSPQQLRDRLDERFAVLTGGSRDALPRHRTLRALIDWSYDLLDEGERRLFRRLGRFVNGFTLEGATAVGRSEHLDGHALFEVLASLVDKSLVLAEPAGEFPRYRMLETTRQYAREKIVAANEGERCATRHLHYLRDRFGAVYARRERTGRYAEHDAVFAAELEDVRAALDWAASFDVASGGELLAVIATRWESIGLEREGMAHLERFIAALPPHAARLTAALWTAFSRLTLATGQTQRAFALAARAVESARASGDAETLSYALVAYVYPAAFLLKFDAARTALAEATALAPAHSVALRSIELRYARAVLSQFGGDLEQAAHVYDELRAKELSLDNRSRAAAHGINLAEIEHRLRRTERAVAIVHEELPAIRASRNRAVRLNALTNVAGYLVALERFAESRAAAREALRFGAKNDPDNYNLTFAIEALALGCALEARLERAAILAGYAQSAQRRLGRDREFTELTTRNRLDAVLHEHLAAGTLAELTGRGAALSAPGAIAFALDDDAL